MTPSLWLYVPIQFFKCLLGFFFNWGCTNELKPPTKQSGSWIGLGDVALKINFVGTTWHKNLQNLETLGPHFSIHGEYKVEVGKGMATISNGTKWGQYTNFAKECLSMHVAGC